VVIQAQPAIAELIERSLLNAGVDVVRTRVERPDVLKRLLRAGMVVLVETAGDVSMGQLTAGGALEFIPFQSASTADVTAAQLLQELQKREIIPTEAAEDGSAR
jgi:hypothetical protein